MAKRKTDQRTRMKHPMQPVGLDTEGIARFKENKIISWLVTEVDNAVPTRAYVLNRICALMLNGAFPREDYEQFNQLLGYSVCGYCDFDNDKISAKVKDAAWDAMEALDTTKRR